MSDHQHTTPDVDPRLIESEERYRAVIENASDMIQSVRPDGTFEFVNPAWLHALGYTQEEVDGMIVWDVIHEDAVAHCRPLFARAIRGEPIEYMETTFKTRDGRKLPVEGNITSRFIGETVVATHGFFRDITERLRARELEERNLELERAEQARYMEKMAALGKLSAGLAHELNNPAAAVQRANAGLMDSLVRREAALRALASEGLDAAAWLRIDQLGQVVLRGDDWSVDSDASGEAEDELEEWLDAHDVERGWEIAPGLVDAGVTVDQLDALAASIPPSTIAPTLDWLSGTADIHEAIEIIRRSSHRISELVSVVKGYTYMDRATEQTVDVHEGLESTLIMLGHRLRDVSVVRDYDRQLPPVHAFGNTLNQVWTNIIDNAIDAMDGKGRLVVRTRREETTVVVEIEDNGGGIAPDDLARIFEPFFTTKPQGEGTGLGLDTAWRIVTEEHGGTITVTSDPGRTVFRVALPLPPEG